tara:strand:- start:4492 stop:6210 length:1719 start_codon:yes stop_codon:yes gene_type:complete
MEKINKLKRYFRKEKIDGYIISKNDEFFGEYTPAHNDRLNFISNFSGSYGLALIIKEKNYLFVDGRYTIQANNQSGNYFKVITIPNKMPYDVLKNKKLTIGFDPKLFTNKSLNIFFSNSRCSFKPINKNLIDKIWKRKVKVKCKKFYTLPENSVGNNYKNKINKIISNLRIKKADFQFITASENVAWLLNIRGMDTEYAPIPYSHVLVSKSKKIYFFCDLKKISKFLRKKLNKVKFINTEMTAKVLNKIYKQRFVIDKNTCSFYYQKIILKNNKIIDDKDPIDLFKAIKNKKEISNMKKAHIYDGVALTKYLIWLKKNFSKKVITEISGSNKLFYFRKKNKKFKFLSFPTISSTGPNGAIIHYKPSNKTNRVLKDGDIYLVDSGGQYEFGTTDVTRTISLNNSSQKIRNIFTRVLKGHIAVANYNLKKGTSGSQIDYKARRYLKEIGLDYAHGTGHGVGYYLNVHEGPHAISKNNKIKFMEGMIVSNEPGYYEKNNFGIRIENLIYVKKIKKRNYFENLTLAPLDKELINLKLLNKNEINWINKYHNEVFKNIKNYFNKDEIKDLRKACSII